MNNYDAPDLPPAPKLSFSDCYDYPRKVPMSDPRLILTKQHGWIVAAPEPGGYRTTLGGWFIYDAAVRDSRPTPAVPAEETE